MVLRQVELIQTIYYTFVSTNETLYHFLIIRIQAIINSRLRLRPGSQRLEIKWKLWVWFRRRA